jgi:hypothetical protein
MADKPDPRQPIGSANFPTGAMTQKAREEQAKKQAQPPKRPGKDDPKKR